MKNDTIFLIIMNSYILKNIFFKYFYEIYIVLDLLVFLVLYSSLSWIKILRLIWIFIRLINHLINLIVAWNCTDKFYKFFSIKYAIMTNIHTYFFFFFFKFHEFKLLISINIYILNFKIFINNTLPLSFYLHLQYHAYKVLNIVHQ